MDDIRVREGAGDQLDELERLAPLLVGTGWILDVQERLLRAMLIEALRRTTANYTRAARLLGVKRQEHSTDGCAPRPRRLGQVGAQR